MVYISLHPFFEGNIYFFLCVEMTEEQGMSGDMVISTTKLFVGGLDWDIRGRELNDEFSKY